MKIIVFIAFWHSSILVLLGQSLSIDTTKVALMPQAFDEWIETTVLEDTTSYTAIRNIVLERLKQSRYTSSDAILLASKTLIKDKKILSESQDNIIALSKKEISILEQINQSIIYINKLLALSTYTQEKTKLKLLNRKAYLQKILVSFYNNEKTNDDLIKTLNIYLDKIQDHLVKYKTLEFTNIVKSGDIYAFSLKDKKQAEKLYLSVYNNSLASNLSRRYNSMTSSLSERMNNKYKYSNLKSIVSESDQGLLSIYRRDLNKLMNTLAPYSIESQWLEAIENLGGDIEKYYEIHYGSDDE